MSKASGKHEIYWCGKCSECPYAVTDHKAFSQPNWDCLYFGQTMVEVTMNGGCIGPKKWNVLIAKHGKHNFQKIKGSEHSGQS